MATRNHIRLFHALIGSAFALAVCGASAAQITSRQPPNPNITAPGPQKHQAPSQPQPLPPGTKAPQPIMQAPPNGTVFGFVYWDTNAVSHVPPSSCSGLAITVSLGSQSGPFTSYTPMGTQTNFKYVGMVQTSGTSYEVCAYSYGHVPVGPSLQVKLTIPQPIGIFSPVATPQYAQLAPVQINNSQCNKLPPLTKATITDLSGNWGTCQNVAYDVNFLLVKGSKLISQSSSGGSNANQGSSQPGVLLNQIGQSGMPNNTSPANPGTGSVPSNGMRLPAVTPPPMLAPATSTAGTPSQLLTPKPSPGGTELNLQPFPPKGTTSVPGRVTNTAMNPAGESSNWKSNKFVASAMSHVSVLTPANSMLRQNAGNSALVSVLRKQSLAAQSLLASSARPVATNGGSLLSGGSTPMLNSQMPPNGSASQVAAGQIMSSPGSGSSGVSNARTQQSSKAGTNVIASQVCKVGIAAVDGQKSGVWFTPLSGPDGMFVIQGCGFGTTPGQIYLSGVHYASASTSSAPMGSSLAPDQIAFQVASGSWSDRQIMAQIDPNASGFFDTNNVTLVIKNANGQMYQAAGFNFSAARADQALTAILKAPNCSTSQNGCVPSGIKLASVNSVNGQVQADVESPSVSLIKPGETIAVARQSMTGQFPIPAAPGLSFPGATDIYQFKFAPGFQLDPHTGVQLQHTSLDNSYCQSVNGVPATNGNWSLNYLSTSSFQVSWQEEACWPKSSLNSASTQQWLEYGSVSAYALNITVLGPRGVSPWPSGNTNVLTIQTHQQLLTH